MIPSPLARAKAHHRAGRLDQAMADYQALLALAPDDADCLHAAGLLDLQCGRVAEAVEKFTRALVVRPGSAPLNNDLGVSHLYAGRSIEARACFERALALDPSYVDSLNNLAVLQLGLGEDATELCRRAVALAPGNAISRSTLGVALLRGGEPEEACVHLRQAVQAMPGSAEILSNLGVATQQTGQLREAIDIFRHAVTLAPDRGDIGHNLGMALLGVGEFAQGWPLFEGRWQTTEMRPFRRDFSQPQWRGEEICGKSILVHAEQGFGDTLQFCRYVPMLVERGARVILEVQPPLKRLLGGMPDPVVILARGEALPPFDWHCPLLSLPLAFETRLETIPGDVPYIKAEPGAVAQWGRRLGPGFKIGLVWAGNARRQSAELAAIDRRRSIAPGFLAPLAVFEDVRFVSLQKDGAPPPFPMIDLMASVEDFADTAALIANLDLIITVDTAVAHLAGAMAKPAWLLDRFDTCWRWLRDRDDSPWYPTLRLFRQPRFGDWPTVIARVGEALKTEIISRKGTGDSCCHVF